MAGMTHTPTDDGLNDRQKTFVAEYLARKGNATEAYKAAGYAATGNAAEAGASRLLKHPLVAAAIKAHQLQTCERAQIDADIVVAGLLAEARREGRGSSHSARVAAWTTLARLLGLFDDPTRVRPRDDDVSGLTDEELDAEMERAEAELQAMRAIPPVSPPRVGRR